MVTIREGTGGDAAAVAAFGRVVLPVTYDPISTAYTRRTLATYWGEDHLRGSLERIRWLLALDETASVVGVANLDERGGTPVIWMLYVHPDHQGTGLGGRLLDRILVRVPRTATEVRLSHVDGNDRAASFYRHRGFVEVDREPARDGLPGEVWRSRSRAT